MDTDSKTDTGGKRKVNKTGDRKSETTDTDSDERTSTPNIRGTHNMDPEDPSQAGDTNQGRPTGEAMNQYREDTDRSKTETEENRDECEHRAMYCSEVQIYVHTARELTAM